MKHHLVLWKKFSFFKTLQNLALRLVNDQFLIGVTGVIFNHKNEVLLVKHTYRKHAWSLPGGFLQHKEYPKEGLEREILEETGFTVKIFRIITTKTNHKGNIDLSYFGEYVSGKFKPSDEVSRHRFVSPDKLPKLIEDQYHQIREGLERKKKYDSSKRWRKIKSFFTWKKT